MFFDTRYSNNPPFGASINLAGPNLGYGNGFSALTNPWAVGQPQAYPGGIPFPALNSVSKNMVFPTAGVYVNSPIKSQPQYLEQWNLSIQKQMGSWLFSGTYIGSETKHLPLSYEGNPAFNIPGTCTGGGFFPAPYNNVPDGLSATGPCSSTSNTANRRLLYLASPPPTTGASNSQPILNPGIFYSTIGTLDQSGNANYNGLLLSAQHRLDHNFSILANWTYSHCMSDAETLELTGPSYIIPGHSGLSYSNCDSDVRHVINISAIANTPKFENHLMNAIVGGWQFSPIITYRTGTYSSVTMGSDVALSGIGGQIAQQVSTNFFSPSKGGFTAADCFSTPSNIATCPATKFQVNYLNSATAAGVVGAWAAPVAGGAGGCTGTLPTITVNGGVYSCSRPLTVENPTNFEFDMSLVRTFPIRESQTLQFRWEVFNVPNKLNLGNPSSSISSFANPGTFGLITSALNPRIMQFALKYVF